MAQVFIGLLAEGTTDHRFLEPIIEKLALEIAFDFTTDIDIITYIIKCNKGRSFTEFISNALHECYQNGLNILVIHSDADDDNHENVMNYKFIPMLTDLEEQITKLDLNIVPLIPIHETEAWMISDIETLLEQIGTNKSATELCLNGNPEEFNDPKSRIENAIKIGRQEMPKKLRNKLTIDNLYDYLGQVIELENLSKLSSFQKFQTEMTSAFERIPYLSKN